MSLRLLIIASAAAFAAVGTVHASTTFSLAGSVGSTPPLSITSGGITATFSSPAGNGFQIQNTAGLLNFNTALLDNNFFGTDPLTIGFSAPVSGQFVVPFAILDAFSSSGLPDTLTFTTNTGQTVSFTGTPDTFALQEPEGTASFLLSAPTSSITLTSANAFAIGNVSTVTPEPTSFVLLATGLVGMTNTMRRRRR